MESDYQHNYSDLKQSVFNIDGRQRKATTMVKVLDDKLAGDLAGKSVLSVGGSSGIIEDYLAQYFGDVVSVDIDEKAINFAREQFERPNLQFEIGDAMNLRFEAESFDVVICAHVYEHVPDSSRMIDEIFRVLKPGGSVYFAAGNRISVIEPHYKLPFLSIPPRPVSNLYLRLTGKGTHYYEKHLTYWGLKRLVRDFTVSDYTAALIEDPERYETAYMVSPGSATQRLGTWLARYVTWLMPSWIWVLTKPST